MVNTEAADRADAAEAAVLQRNLRRLWTLPGTRLGVVGWPAVRQERLFGTWHYWWQAHLIDCAIDAANRAPTPGRTARVGRIARAHRIRNLTGWTNNFYDDMAWLALALERAQRTLGIDHRGALSALQSQLYRSWAPEHGGGIPWCRGSDFYNAPANGPAGIALARLGNLDRATEMADWLDAALRDPSTGLILDGIRPAHAEGQRLDRAVYSYCQGVVLGLESELAARTGAERHTLRVRRLVAAVQTHLTRDGVLTGGGGGDGGLFNGILARYLALVAMVLPGNAAGDETARSDAARIVLASADAAWSNRLDVAGLPLFGPHWLDPARLPETGAEIARFDGGTVRASAIPERDLSVQLGGWMLMEAAALLSAAGY